VCVFPSAGACAQSFSVRRCSCLWSPSNSVCLSILYLCISEGTSHHAITPKCAEVLHMPSAQMFPRCVCESWRACLCICMCVLQIIGRVKTGRLLGEHMSAVPAPLLAGLPLSCAHTVHRANVCNAQMCALCLLCSAQTCALCP